MTWKLAHEAVTLQLAEIELEGDLYYDVSQHALLLVDPEDGEEEILTVNLLTYGYTAMPGEVLVRDYSEHSGLPSALVVAGVAEQVEEIKVGPFDAHVQRMRVIDAASEQEQTQ